MRRLFAAAYVSAALLLSPAFAVQPDEVMADPAKEARARELSRELRCMVCQNQSIDDSEAPLARDLRLLVRERIAAGDRTPDLAALGGAAAGPDCRRRGALDAGAAARDIGACATPTDRGGDGAVGAACDGDRGGGRSRLKNAVIRRR